MAIEAEAGAARREWTPSPEAAHRQPEPPQQPDQPDHRAPGLQPSVVIQPADQQAAAIQAIADQLHHMQQEVRDFQASAAKDREDDRREMLRRTAALQPTAPEPSRGEKPQAQPMLPYPPRDSFPTSRQEPPYPTQGYPAPSRPPTGHPQSKPTSQPN